VPRILQLAALAAISGTPAWSFADDVTHVASAADTPTPRESATDRVSTDEAEPDPAVLSAAPPADKASGVAVPGPRTEHPVANWLLALPRTTAVILLAGPRYAAAELDDYMESRSPDAFGRGTSLGVRIGRELGDGTSVDAYAGLFGARGQSAGLAAKLGSYGAYHVAPSLTFDAGRSLDRVFAGVGDPMTQPRVVFEREELTGAVGVHAHDGPMQISARAIGDTSRNAGNDDLTVAYGVMPVPGFDETERAATGELSIAYDSRRGSYPWVRRSAPSEGTLIRATGAYVVGRASDTGKFATGRGTFEVRQLFDLFHGDRVLTIGGRAEAVSAQTDDLPFDRLPALGGRDLLRAFALDQLRGRVAAAAEVVYEWPLASDSHGFVFVETGGVERIHVGYGAGLRFLRGAATWARLQVAGADDGVIGAYFQLGAL
jgi:hypothetical protein